MAEPRPIDAGKESRAAAGIPVVPAFDGFRAYAILGVVMLHVLLSSGVVTDASPHWRLGLLQGTLGQGIDVLFVISGFVVFLPTVARHGRFGSVGAYAIRRAARIVPAYWVMLGVVLVLIAVVSSETPTPFPGPGSILAHATFLHTPVSLAHRLRIGFGVDGPVWTLSLEMTFYALLPLVAAWYFRRPLLGLALAAGLTAVWHEAAIHYADINSWLGLRPSPETAFRQQLGALSQFPFFAYSFAAGMTGAWAYVRLREAHPPAALARRIAPFQVGALAALALFAYLIGHNARGVLFGAEIGRRDPIISLGFSTALTAVMVTIALGRARWQRPFAHPLVRRLGDISYGVYLVHLVVIFYVVQPVTEQVAGTSHGDGRLGTFALTAAIVFPLSLLYGWLSARYVEQPIRRWAHRFGARGQAVRRPATAQSP